MARMIQVVHTIFNATGKPILRRNDSMEKPHSRKVKFQLSPEQEEKADRPFRDSYYEMKNALQRKKSYNQYVAQWVERARAHTEGMWDETPEPAKDPTPVADKEEEKVDTPLAEKQEEKMDVATGNGPVDEDDEDYGITVTYSNPKKFAYEKLWGELYSQEARFHLSSLERGK